MRLMVVKEEEQAKSKFNRRGSQGSNTFQNRDRVPLMLTFVPTARSRAADGQAQTPDTRPRSIDCQWHSLVRNTAHPLIGKKSSSVYLARGAVSYLTPHQVHLLEGHKAHCLLLACSGGFG